MTGLSKLSLTLGISSGVSVPTPAAAKSRAMPYTPRQSPRFGVMAISIIWSVRPSASAAFEPICASLATSIMPSCSSERPISRSDNIIPLDVIPRILVVLSVTLIPGI